jgi:hypothetical protein
VSLTAQGLLFSTLSLVAIEYRSLEPNGRAYLKLTHPDYLLPNLDALEKVTISGVHLVAEPSDRAPMSDQLNGNGLSSELDSNGKNVVISGLPKSMKLEGVDRLLKGFSFPPGEPYIFKIPRYSPNFLLNRFASNLDLSTEAFIMTRRFLVRLVSVPEAHRLVCQLHLRWFRPELYQLQYPIRARVIY